MLVLDDADMTLIFKEKGKLNRIIKNCPITSEERTVLLLTRDYSNCW